MLPFTVKFKAELKDSNKQNAIPIINTYLSGREANIVKVTNTELTFKGSSASFSTNWNIFNSVDKGTFTIVEKNVKPVLIYEIFLYGLFIFCIPASIIFAIVVDKIWVGFLMFFWLGVVNWIISTTRNKGLMDEILYRIKVSQNDIGKVN